MNFKMLPLLAVFLASSTALAASPSVGFIYPAGACRGTDIEVTVAGRQLRGIHTVWISGEGVTGTIRPSDRTAPGKSIAALREELNELRKQQKRLEPDKQDRLKELASQLLTLERRQANPAIAERLAIHVKIAKNAPLGTRELRVIGVEGVSAPLPFVVSSIPEFIEPQTTGSTLIEARKASKERLGPIADFTNYNVSLPVVINGQIMPGDVDHFWFEAKKGQRLVIKILAKQLIPFLADAVPGWFQALALLEDENGKELSFSDDDRFDPDPLILFEVPKTARYRLVIRDALFRGREDFVYRVSLGELPYITSLHPLGGRLGESTTVRATESRNLIL